MSAPQDLSAAGLYKSDPLLKDLPFDKYSKVASDESIAKTKAALEAKKHEVTVVANKAEALELLKKTIPKGVSVMNAFSTSLIEIGYIEYLKTQTEWNNLHADVLAETDPAKQAEKRRLASTADYFVVSVTAISEDGILTVCDLSGNRTAPFSYTAGKMIIVAGANKIVPTYEDAVKRTEEYCLPLESARARIAYGVPASAITNFVRVNSASPFAPNRFHIIIVKEALGF